MANFPVVESQIVTLAQEMVTGFTGQEGVPPVYPAPPVPAVELTTLLTAFTAARDAAMTASATAKQATESKSTALAALVGGMKTDLHYAQDTVAGDDARLGRPADADALAAAWPGPVPGGAAAGRRDARAGLEAAGRPRTASTAARGRKGPGSS